MGKSPRFGEQNELVRALRKQLEAADLELAKQKWVFEKVLQSPSWKLTLPLRWLAGQVRSLRRRITGSIPPRTTEISEQDTAPKPESPAQREHVFASHNWIPLRALLSSGETLRLPNSDAPEISVILVLYDRAELTMACLRSLRESSSARLQIIIVDNASSDETASLLERIDGARVIRNSQKQSFPIAVNEAARQAAGRYLLLLSNDAQALPGSLASALATLHGRPGIGAVCGRIIGPDGLLQEAGSILWRDATSMPYGLGDDPFAPMYVFRRDVDCGSAVFLLTPRSVWERLGGFDETFTTEYEEDYCARLCEDDLRIVYEPNAVILRLAESPDLHGEPREMFFQRHSRFLADQWAPDPVSVVKARARNRYGKRLLFLDDRVPHAWLGAGLPRARAILLSIVKQGYFVTFFPLDVEDEDWPSVYSDMPNEVEFMMGFGRLMLQAFLRNRTGYYDTILVSRPHNMALLQPILIAHPNWFQKANIVYDAEALFAFREIAKRELEQIPWPEDEARRQIKDETALASEADSVISVSEHERATFREHGIERVHVLGHSLVAKPTPLPFEERKGFLFVGAITEESSPNADSIVWFLTEIFPTIRAELGANVTMMIAGVNNSKRIEQLAGPSVQVRGFVTELSDFYNAARVFVAPTRYAAGIPHKVHEAAAYGLPVVATPLLAAQLGWQDGGQLAVGTGPDSFAKKCIELYTNKALWTRLRLSALDRVQTECSPVTFENRLKEILSADKRIH